MRPSLLRACSAFFLTAALSTTALAYDLGEDAEYGKILGDFRYRFDDLRKENYDKPADASTARLRLGYQTPTWEGFTGYVEGETIQYIGNDDFNDGANHKTDRPSINDPYDTGLNQLYLNYKMPHNDTGATVGRQVITFDTERFIGRSNFRQNDTTYDGVHFTLNPLDGLHLDYAYVDDAHRSLGTRETQGEYTGDVNLYHADYQLPADFKIIGYAYLLDFNQYIAGLSSDTYGGRLEWRPKEAMWEEIKPWATAEYAWQRDGSDNPQSYHEPYNWLELGGDYHGFDLSAIYEMLGGNGHSSFQTPLASTHNFNGLVNDFTTIPVDGLRDYYLKLKAPLDILPWKDQKLDFTSEFHEFHSYVADVNYGHEFDVGLIYTPVQNQYISAEAGHLYADSTVIPDTSKVWITYGLKF